MKTFDPHGQEMTSHLSGAPLTGFKRRAFAFAIDVIIAFFGFLLVLGIYGVTRWLWETGGDTSQHYVVHFKADTWYGEIVMRILLPLLYFGLTTYFWNGQTLGKKLMRIRVVSLLHERISL